MEPRKFELRYIAFKFFRVDPAWRRLPKAERETGIGEFQAAVEAYRSRAAIVAYTTQGFRGDCDFMLWATSPELATLHDLHVDLFKTALGAYLETPYHYLAMTRDSTYTKDHGHSPEIHLGKGEGRYIFVYPFWKTREWYLMPFEARQEIMNEHIRVGQEFPSVRLNTCYSFGVDDQEFMLAFETNVPDDFQRLVMRLRETDGSRFTLRDTPIFTGMKLPLEEILRSLG
ncbi:MAG: chlorite dismutase family protein [Deltaproteobacteria bacterium]|nr:chlorite dismutase family protein [Deltaproteobacteria bacterium]MBI3078025.1 chlorite dismutase family protein [Deltaproteobacteria bacterium]